MLDRITSQPLVSEEGILVVARRTGSIHSTLFAAADTSQSFHFFTRFLY